MMRISFLKKGSEGEMIKHFKMLHMAILKSK
jgi:hypothetical protein